MKSVILFFVLFSLLIVNINANLEDPYHDSDMPMPTKCEDVFNATTCGDCQLAIWNSWTSTSTCGYVLHLITNVVKEYVSTPGVQPYDLGPYNAAVKETCSAEFTCKYEEAEELWKGVESSCQKELNTVVDWSANPTTIDMTVSSAYGTVLIFYFGIPDHAAQCIDKSSSGELCGIDYIVPFIEWLKKEVPDGKFLLSYDNQFVYKHDGSRIEVPRKLIACGDCIEKMKKEYEHWPEQHPLPDYLVKNLFGSWEDVKKYYTCPTYKFRKMFRRQLINGGFSHLIAASKLKF